MKSTSRVIPFILVILAFLVSFCGEKDSKSSSGTTEVPADSALVSDTALVIDNDTVTVLPGNSITGGLTGAWSLISITNENGLNMTDASELSAALLDGKIVKFDNINGPATKLRGQLFYTYNLRWTVTNGSQIRSKDVSVRFKLDSLFNIGQYTQTIIAADTSLTLYAKALNKSLKAKWSIIEKSTDYALFSIDTTYKTTFYGRLTGKYLIEYKIHTRDNAFERTKRITVRFDLMTDTRDAQVYKVVKIGTKIWMAQNLNFLRGFYYNVEYSFSTSFWPNESPLATTYTASATSSNGVTYVKNYYHYNVLFYNGDSTNRYINNYGCYYTYAAAVYKSATSVVTVKIAPPGWHVADTTDWHYLDSMVNQNAAKLKSTKTWLANAGTDDYGLGLNAGGYIVYTPYAANVRITERYTSISSRGMGEKALFWSILPGAYQYTVYPSDSLVKAVQFSQSNNSMTRVTINEKKKPGGEGRYTMSIRCVRDNKADE